MSKTNVLCLLGLAAGFLCVPASAADAQAGPTPTAVVFPVVTPAIECAALTKADVSAIVGAKTHIAAAAVVTDAKMPPYCRVLGYVEPQVKFEVRLPMKSWTQRLVQTGCGGLCGNLEIRLAGAEGCVPANHGELALASTDMGHTGGMEAEFGEDAQQRIDFAYRGVHVTALAAKAIISAFYGQGPRYSYFSGCSDGGREGLMEAQRYPRDFNGIIAGAPAINFTTQNTFYHAWNALKNRDVEGKPILTADALPVLHRAAIEACDASDGLKDGLIGDPIGCKFDPETAECKSGKTPPNCLTHAEAEAARAIYAGAHTGAGEKLVLGGPLPGSELAWAGVFVPFSNRDQTMSPAISTGTLRYLAYKQNPGAAYTLTDLAYTAESFEGATELHGFYDATDPKLGAFSKAGGKLILWHGLADPHISPLNTIAYYTAMLEAMGQANVDGFARLYLFPGGYHCGGGEGPSEVDLLTPMMAWAEAGMAPTALIASHRSAVSIAGVPAETPLGGRPGTMSPRGPGSPSVGARQAPMHNDPSAPPLLSGAAPTIDRTRPVFPYPQVAKYMGKGSIDDARNFEAGQADPLPAGVLEWLGSSFFSSGFELWCMPAGGARMDCMRAHSRAE